MKKLSLFAILLFSLSGNAQLTQITSHTSANGFDATQVDDMMIYKNEFYGSSERKSTSIALRKFDGTTITEIKSFPAYYPTPATGTSAYPMMLYGFNKTENKLYFIVSQTLYEGYTSKESTSELWVTDGTSAGTTKLYTVVTPNGNFSFDIIPFGGNNGLNPTNHNFIGDKLIFATKNSTMVTDGTVAGTKPLTANGTSISRLAFPGPKINEKYYFSDSSGNFYKTDGTDAGTEKILDNTTVSIYSFMSRPLNGKFLFWGNTVDNGTELWESDGTAAGTKLFLETAPGTDFKKPIYGASIDMANDGEQIYFLINPTRGTDNNNIEVWATDLTAANTRKIKDASSYLPEKTIIANGYIYFTEALITSPFTRRLWSSDGTYEGTKKISEGYDITSMTIYQNSIFFDRAEKKVFYLNQNIPTNFEVWKSDGLTENTRMVLDIYPGTYGTPTTAIFDRDSDPTMFFVLNDKLYFKATNSSGDYIYKFNGDYTFTGTANNNWSNASNWKSGITPGQQDLVNIPAGFNVAVDFNAFAKDLNLNSALNLTSGNLNILGDLNLSEKIILNNNSLTLAGTSSQISNANSTNYIVTNGTGTVNIQNLDNARGSVTLPIGTTTNYNPITISNSGTADTFSVKVSEGIANMTNGAVNSTWDISEATAGGSNINISLAWNESQENSTFARSTASVGHFVDGIWKSESSGTVIGTNPFTISATGITSFSPFSVMNFGAMAINDLSKSKVSVYPNPFNDNLNILTQENGEVYFYDMSGKLISTSMLMKGSNSLNKSYLNKGIYLYQVKGKDGSVIASGKVIKK